MIRRDVNHPSILFWDNGNEGGWNKENDGEFAKWDPQQRTVASSLGEYQSCEYGPLQKVSGRATDNCGA